MGPSGVGKSRLMMRYQQKGLKDGRFNHKSFNITGNCTPDDLKEVLSRGMVLSKQTGVYKPAARGSTNLFFIDDLNMCKADEFDIKCPLELLRQWMDYQGWYDNRDKNFVKIKNLQFCASVSLPEDGIRQSDKGVVDERFMWKFAIVTFINSNGEKNQIQEIFTQILTFVVETWVPEIGGSEIVDKITKGTFQFYEYLQVSIPLSPISFTQKVNQRHLLSALFGIVELNGRNKQNTDDIASIFVHEIARSMLDRIYDYDIKKECFDTLHQMAVEIFCLDQRRSKLLPQDMHAPFYSYMKKDFNDYYTKCTDNYVKEIMTIEELLDEYNQVNFKTPIEVALFSFMTDNIIKTNRSLRQPWPGTILIANEGCGAQ